MNEDFFELVEEMNIAEVVKTQGGLVIATQNTDWDEAGNFIGDYSELHKRAEKYVKRYNPKGLSDDEYRKAYSRGELHWQN